MSGVGTLLKMSYSEEAAVSEGVDEDYVLIPRSSFNDEEQAGYYVVDLRTKEPWLVVKTCCSCGGDRVWMKQVLMSLKDNIDRRVAECPRCHGLLRFKQDGTDFTDRVDGSIEETEQPNSEVLPVQTATLSAGENASQPAATDPSETHTSFRRLKLGP